MTTKPDYIRQSLHADDLDDDGHDVHGITPVVVYAECNTPPVGTALFHFDTFYDITWSVIGSLPASLGLSYAAGTFTATEDGVWVISLGAIVIVNPGGTSQLALALADYGFSQILNVKAAGNESQWTVERTAPMVTGESFQFGETGTTATTYAEMNIVRMARSVS